MRNFILLVFLQTFSFFRPCTCADQARELRQRAAAAEVASLKLKRDIEIRMMEQYYRDGLADIGKVEKIIEK